MKHFLELIPLSAKAHRRQHRMTLFCIALAVFLVTSIFSMADMELRSQKIKALQDYGNWHIMLKHIDEESAGRIALRPDVAASSWYNVLNYRLNDAYAVNGHRAVVCGIEEGFLSDIMQIALAEGSFPAEEGQAILTQNAKDSLGVALGDTVALHTPSGAVCNLTISGFGADTILSAKTDAVCILLPTDAFRTLYSAAAQNELSDSDLVYYVQFKEQVNIPACIRELKEQYGLADDDIAQNAALLGVMGFGRDSYMLGLYGAAAILFVFVLTAGVLMIASSINSSIAQRTAFFGMLRCIGADRRQTMRFVRLEALFWCRIAIPAGALAGVIFTWFLCAVLRLLSGKYFADLPLFGISTVGIAMGILVGLLTVMIAAQAPAKKAASVPPLTAVSGNAYTSVPIRHAANTSRIKIPAALGLHHAVQNRKNLILMAGSFAVSIVLFLGFSPLVNFMNCAVTPLQPYAPDVSILSADNTCMVPFAYKDRLHSLEGVKSVYGRKFAYDISAQVYPAQISSVRSSTPGSASSGDSYQKNIMLLSYDAIQFNWVDEHRWASDQRALEQVAKDVQEGFVLAAYSPTSSVGAGDRIETALGDLTVCGMLNRCPYNSDPNTAVLVCSEALFTELTGAEDYTILDIKLRADAPKETIDAIRAMTVDGLSFSDSRPGNQEVKGAYYAFAVFIYGFLAVIALIAACNIVNSISLSAASRTTQYGAMRAVGMSTAQMTQMIAAEAGAYALSGIIAGCLIGLPLHALLWRLLIAPRWQLPWQLPLSAIAAITAVVLLSCAAAVHGPAKRLKARSIVDALSCE